MDELLKKIEIAKCNIIIINPFFGNLLAHLIIKNSNKIKYMETDGDVIYVNDKNLKNFEEKELEFLLLHQMYHIILFHIFRATSKDNIKKFDRACDYVVNVNIMTQFPLRYTNFKNIGKITMHLPNGKNPINYTAEQVYNMIHDEKDDNENQIDDHMMWQESSKSIEERNEKMEKWSERINSCFNENNDAGNICGSLMRQLKLVSEPKINWKDLLYNYIEEEIVDYSFNPPDKRFINNNLILPDFNEIDEKICNIFFFVDVSSSMSDKEISECISEISSCIMQYNGKVDGYIAYFDYEVSEIIKITEDNKKIDKDILGGGGTSFKNIFKFLKKNKHDCDYLKKKVIILTDGYAPYPDENDVENFDLLWIINNEVAKPNIGKVIRI